MLSLFSFLIKSTNNELRLNALFTFLLKLNLKTVQLRRCLLKIPTLDSQLRLKRQYFEIPVRVFLGKLFFQSGNLFIATYMLTHSGIYGFLQLINRSLQLFRLLLILGCIRFNQRLMVVYSFSQLFIFGFQILFHFISFFEIYLQLPLCFEQFILDNFIVISMLRQFLFKFSYFSLVFLSLIDNYQGNFMLFFNVNRLIFYIF